METIYEVWRKRDDREYSSEGRIDWRQTREAAERLRDELDEDTSDEHVVIEELCETEDNSDNSGYRIK